MFLSSPLIAEFDTNSISMKIEKPNGLTQLWVTEVTEKYILWYLALNFANFHLLYATNSQFSPNFY